MKAELQKLVRSVIPAAGCLGLLLAGGLSGAAPSRSGVLVDEVRLLAPTTARPALVGNFESPRKMEAHVVVSQGGAFKTGLFGSDFSVRIGDASATVIALVQLDDRYVLSLRPPSQAAPGVYPLELTVGGVTAGAGSSVRYSATDQANIDLVLTIDRSGSMGFLGFMEPAKEAAILFIDQLRSGDQLGIVSFNDLANVDFPLSPLSDTGTGQIFLAEGAEAPTTLWTTDGAWARTTELARTGAYSWTDSPGATYANNIAESLYSPEITIEGLAHPTLRFWHQFALQDQFDFGVVWATTDLGAYWWPIGLFTGQQSDWSLEQLGLGRFQGVSSFLLAFTLFSNDDTIVADGWHIDDIEIGDFGALTAARSAIRALVPEFATSIGGGLLLAEQELSGLPRSGSTTWHDSPFGDYPNNADALLMSPPIPLPPLNDLRLQFWHRYNIEQGYDFGRVSISTDDGDTWTLIGEFTGLQAAWTQQTFDISGFAGAPAARVGFQLASDGSFAFDGWHLDDLSIFSASQPSEPIFSDNFEGGLNGWTAMGGWAQFRGRASADHSPAILLMSDGFENSVPFVAEVLPLILERSTRVFTIALGPESDEVLLQSIATATGGAYFQSPGAGDLGRIYSLLAGQVIGDQTLLSLSGTVGAGGTEFVGMSLDPAISEATFSVSWTSPQDELGLTIGTPGGGTLTPETQDPRVTFLPGPTFRSYRVMDPSPGVWTLEITGVSVGGGTTPAALAALRDRSGWIEVNGDTMPSPEKLAGLVRQGTAASDFTAVVTVKSDLTLKSFFASQQFEVGDPVPVVAVVSDTQPIVGATVTGEVTLPDSSKLNLTFFDDGAHKDSQANDGVYGAELASATQTGTHAFKIEATGQSTDGFSFMRVEFTSTVVVEGEKNRIRRWGLYD